MAGLVGFLAELAPDAANATIPARTTRGLSTSVVGFVLLVFLGLALAEHDLVVVVERTNDLDEARGRKEIHIIAATRNTASPPHARIVRSISLYGEALARIGSSSVSVHSLTRSSPA